MQGNLRLLSPRLFAMGRGWRRGPSSSGQSATATRSAGRTPRRLGPRGLLLQTGEPGSRFGVMVWPEITRKPPSVSPQSHFFSTSARAQPSWVAPRMHRCGNEAVTIRHRPAPVTHPNTLQLHSISTEKLHVNFSTKVMCIFPISYFIIIIIIGYVNTYPKCH